MSKGLKDHEIAQLVNAIRDAVKPMCPYECLRGVVSQTTVAYLEKNNLRIDAKRSVA